MAIRSDADLTRAVLAEVQRTPDARLRELLASAVEHLHGFVRDTQLTEAEFRQPAAWSPRPASSPRRRTTRWCWRPARSACRRWSAC
jgi:hypothetical protein